MPKKARTLSVDFTGVETGGAGRLLPEGQYQFEVEEASIEVGEDSGKEYVALVMSVVDGEFKGTRAYDNLSTSPKALWKMRSFMEAAGLETVDGEMDIDPDDFVGCIVTADVIHEDYKGKPKHRVNGYEIEKKEEEETPTPSTRKKPRAKDDGESTGWKVKQKVTFKDGKKALSGVITEIDGEKITVNVTGSGKATDGEYELDASDLEAA